MTALLDLLQSQIGDGEIAQLSRSLGADPDQVRKAAARTSSPRCSTATATAR